MSTPPSSSASKIQPQPASPSSSAPPGHTSSAPPASYDPPVDPGPASISPATGPPTSLACKPSVNDQVPAACQAEGVRVYDDVDEYFNRPDVQALLAAERKYGQGGLGSNGTIVPQVSAFSNHHMPALHHHCQIRGLVPEFEIGGDQHGGFGGSVKIGIQTITREEKWPTKKAAKEGLAEKGLEVVKAMQLKRKGPSSGSGATENWIGMLQDHYVSSINTGGGPVYVEYIVGNTFACTCKIPAHPTPFGSESTSFSRKKAARFNAAKEAMQFLISNGLTKPADGGLKARKRAKIDQAIEIGLEGNTEATFAQRVNELCPLLNLPLPTYRIQADNSSTPDLLSGATYLPENASPPLPTPGPIGVIHKVDGKKAAKEECAHGIWRVLIGLVADRQKGVEITGIEAPADGVSR